MDEEAEENEKAEEEPVKAAPGKWKKEITKQKGVPEAKNRKWWKAQNQLHLATSSLETLTQTSLSLN